MESVEGEDVKCDTGLVLGLNYGSSSSRNMPWINRHQLLPAETSLDLERSSSNYVVSLEPSLTLGPADDGYCLSVPRKRSNSRVLPLRESDRQSSPNHSGTMSSFSDGHPSRVKNEDLETGSEEMEKVLSQISEELLEEDNGRKKLRLTKEQSALLEDKFKEQSTLNPRQKQALAKQLKLQPRQVEVWFQNRRARTKFKKTKVDCEVLRKCCETLTDENRRLQKELQELKAFKMPPQLYMQLPAGVATFTVCPSCERITAAGGDRAKEPGALVVASKPQFFKPFANSAAC